MKAILVFFLMFAFSYTALAGELKLLTGENLLTQKQTELDFSKSKKATVVTFLSAKCPCSASHIPELITLAKSYPDFKFVAVHSNQDEPLEMAKNYFKSQDLPFEVIQDSKSQIADQFKANKTPHTFVVAQNGEILYRGGVTNSANATKAKVFFLREALNDISSGQKVKVSEGRTLGCFIKRD